eukprot:110423-Alexandrium_andersonii.AAC.1
MIRDTTWMFPASLVVEARFRARLEQHLPEQVGEEWHRRWELAEDVRSQLAEANVIDGGLPAAEHA